MNKTELMNKLTRKINRAGLQLKKHSPEILVIGGVVGAVVSTVLACKATTKLGAILEDHKDKVDGLHDYVEEVGYSEKYTEEDGKKDLTIMYTQTGIEIAKLYAPAIAVGALSITAIFAGHNVLRKRNVALAAAYTMVDKSFKDYRNRVIERFGEDMDKELKYNIKTKEVEEVVVNEDGTETVVTKTVNVIDPNTISDYAKIWAEGDDGWTKDPEYNLYYLKKQQSYANDKLRERGHLFLNEVYDMLGFPRTAAGNIVGWVYNEDDPDCDCFVDFGIYDVNNPAKHNFVNGYERNILLDFNVDGPIIELI